MRIIDQDPGPGAATTDDGSKDTGSGGVTEGGITWLPNAPKA